MLRVFRIALMWLIALAVPVQGSAAVTMFGCGPGHHDVADSYRAVTKGHAPRVDLHSHGPMTEAAEIHDHDSGMSHDHSGSPSAHKVAKGACTPCASCGAVAALLATAVEFEPVPLTDFFLPWVQGRVSSYLPDGLERPPRLFLA